VALDDYPGWHRVGGRSLQFYATHTEIAEWLQETLPPEHGPWSVVGLVWSENRWHPFDYPLEDLEECFARSPNANLWLHSNELTPGLAADDPVQHEPIRKLLRTRPR
jgi:hypothetical protein